MAERCGHDTGVGFEAGFGQCNKTAGTHIVGTVEAVPVNIIEEVASKLTVRDEGDRVNDDVNRDQKSSSVRKPPRLPYPY